MTEWVHIDDYARPRLPRAVGWSAIRDYLEANPRGKHGSIAYHLVDFGLDAREIERSLAGYRRHFAIPAGV